MRITRNSFANDLVHFSTTFYDRFAATTQLLYIKDDEKSLVDPTVNFKASVNRFTWKRPAGDLHLAYRSVLRIADNFTFDQYNVKDNTVPIKLL